MCNRSRLSLLILILLQATICLTQIVQSVEKVAASSLKAGSRVPEKSFIAGARLSLPQRTPPSVLQSHQPRIVQTQAHPANMNLKAIDVVKMEADSLKAAPSPSNPFSKIWNDGKPFEPLGNAMTERAAVRTGIYLEGELGDTLRRQLSLTGTAFGWLYHTSNLKPAIQDIFSKGAKDVLIVLCQARSSKDAFTRNLGSAATEKIVFGNPKINPLYALLYINVICATKQPIDFSPLLSQISAALIGIAQYLHPANIAQNMLKVPGELQSKISALKSAETVTIVDSVPSAELETANPLARATRMLHHSWKARPKPVSQMTDFIHQKVAMDQAELMVVNSLGSLPEKWKNLAKDWLAGTNANLFQSICIGKSSSNEYIRVFTKMIVQVIATSNPKKSPRIFIDFIESLCAAKKITFL